jgi:hypothetical protein
MSISDEYNEYKELITKHPHAVCYDLVDALGGKFRYHRDGKTIFAAIINPKGQFTNLVKNLTLQ